MNYLLNFTDVFTLYENTPFLYSVSINSYSMILTFLIVFLLNYTNTYFLSTSDTSGFMSAVHSLLNTPLLMYSFNFKNMFRHRECSIVALLISISYTLIPNYFKNTVDNKEIPNSSFLISLLNKISLLINVSTLYFNVIPKFSNYMYTELGLYSVLHICTIVNTYPKTKLSTLNKRFNIVMKFLLTYFVYCDICSINKLFFNLENKFILIICLTCMIFNLYCKLRTLYQGLDSNFQTLKESLKLKYD